MRATLLLVALAALFCGALAGPYRDGAGCWDTDTVKKYPIDGFSFRDFVKGQFVKHAWVQGKSRLRRVAELNTPSLATACDFDGVLPIRACYNSIQPGKLGPPQIAGQYGFVGHVQYICPIPGGYQEVAVRCYARLNTLRDNRLLEPSFWAKQPTGQMKEIICDAPTPAFP